MIIGLSRWKFLNHRQAGILRELTNDLLMDFPRFWDLIGPLDRSSDWIFWALNGSDQNECALTEELRFGHSGQGGRGHRGQKHQREEGGSAAAEMGKEEAAHCVFR